MNNFFITGFPRSRTAWLANLFTYKDSFCFHEASKFGGNVYDIAAKITSRKEKFVGNSDCGTLFYYKDLIKLLPDSKIVIVERDINDVKKSLYKFLGMWNDELETILYKTNKHIIDIQDNHETIDIEFEELEGEGNVEEVWRQVVDIEWDHDRWLQLNDTKVELIKEKWITGVNPIHAKELLGV